MHVSCKPKLQRAASAAAALALLLSVSACGPSTKPAETAPAPSEAASYPPLIASPEPATPDAAPTETPALPPEEDNKAPAPDTAAPASEPTPAEEPSGEPAQEADPTEKPTPTLEPMAEPTPEPTPTAEPTPTVEPTVEPTPEPTPTAEPTLEPTPELTPEPTPELTPEPEPTVEPTQEPAPTEQLIPTAEPTPAPETPAPPEPTPASSEVLAPIAGAVPACDPVDPSWFDDVVFVGDSVSLKLNYYENAVDELGKAQFLTAGSLGSGNALWDVSDESVHPYYQGKKMLLEDAIPLTGAHKVYVMLGMNDLALYGLDGSVENLVTLMHRILDRVPNLVIVIQSMTPMASSSSVMGSKLNNDVIRQYNQRLVDTCAAQGWYYVDVGSIMYDSAGYLKQEYCSDLQGMGMHFTNAGCEAWVQYLLTHVPPV